MNQIRLPGRQQLRPHRGRGATLLALGLVTGLSACAVEDGPITPSAATTSDDVATTEPSEGEAALAGTWQLRADYLRDAVRDSDEPHSVPTLTFEDGALGVNTGCNTGGGDYQVSSDQLTIGPVALTMRACEGLSGDLERLVSGLLGAGELTFAVDDVTLLLSAEDGTTLAFSATDGAPGDLGPEPERPDDSEATTTSGPTATGPAEDSGSNQTGTQTQKAKKSDGQTQKAKKSGGQTQKAKKSDGQTQKAKKSGTEAPTNTP